MPTGEQVLLVFIDWIFLGFVTEVSLCLSCLYGETPFDTGINLIFI